MGMDTNSFIAGIAGVAAAALAAASMTAAVAAEPLTVREAAGAPHAPVVEVVDTVSSLGPLAAKPRKVSLTDLVRYHGHPCDGLVVAAAGIAYGLRTLFPDGVVDRTDLAVTTNRSACYGDVAAYLTGARHRYGSLAIDPQLGDEWILHRRSTGATVAVRLRPGIKPAELPKLEAQLRAAECPRALIEKVQQIQRHYALDVVTRPPEKIFEIERLGKYPHEMGSVRPDAAKARCPAR